jgi:hypothetical protein
MAGLFEGWNQIVEMAEGSGVGKSGNIEMAEDFARFRALGSSQKGVRGANGRQASKAQEGEVPLGGTGE